MSANTVVDVTIPGLTLLHSGKVRRVFDLGQYLLMATTDGISAFDVVLPTPIPGKGEVLTRVSRLMMEITRNIVANQLTYIPANDFVDDDQLIATLGDRIEVVHKLTPLPVEAIVRGYLIGSGWKDYQDTGEVCGIGLPQGLQMAQQLPEVIYTPSTKAQAGDHDQNISFDETVALIGGEMAEQVRAVSISLYQRCAKYALDRGIIIADTKFEFGSTPEGTLMLMDEACTPDSSRFWPKDQYRVGISPPSFDKQFVRDYLETLQWNKTPPGPELPDNIVAATARKYEEAERLLTENR